MTEVESLHEVYDVLVRAEDDAGMTVTETEYEPPYAGIWVTMADGSRWVVRIEPQVTKETR